MTDFGHYELIQKIGVGGMAEVWLAEDKKTGRICAIKRILPHLAAEEKFIKMFIDEARLASKLQHPNIARISEIGEFEGTSFIAMEYIDGSDVAGLLDLIENFSYQIPIHVAVEITIRILDALDYAHRFEDEGLPLNIVHRDISPHNILVSKDGDVRLVDFGVAKAVERNAKTETGVIKGKLSYMSPEQILQEELDRRSDIFSVGVVLFELLTQDTPFGRELKAVSAILHKPAPDPKEQREDIPDALSEILQRALEKDTKLRYQSAEEMADALRNFLERAGSRVENTHIAEVLHRIQSVHQLETQEYDRSHVDFNSDTDFVAHDELQKIVEATNNNKKKVSDRLSIPKWALFLLGGVFILGGYGVFFALGSASDSPKPETRSLLFSESGNVSRSSKSAKKPEEKQNLLSFVFSENEVPEERELNKGEIQNVLTYAFKNKPEEYLIDGRLRKISVLLGTKTLEKEKTYKDPGNPKSRYNLRTTLKERKRRREEQKKIRAFRHKSHLKKAKKKRAKKVRARKRKNRMVDKVVPGGF